ncbi:unnamed protein product, partial [Meganyctiphanes norvegica]
GGMGQGGSLALYTAFSFKNPLAGFVAISSWLPLKETFPEVVDNHETRVLHIHGTSDPIIEFNIGIETSNILSRLASQYQFIPIPGMTHTCTDEVLKHFKCFIKDNLPSNIDFNLDCDNEEENV